MWEWVKHDLVYTGMVQCIGLKRPVGHEFEQGVHMFCMHCDVASSQIISHSDDSTIDIMSHQQFILFTIIIILCLRCLPSHSAI